MLKGASCWLRPREPVDGGPTYLPCRRRRSFFSNTQSRLFLTDLPLAFLNRILEPE